MGLFGKKEKKLCPLCGGELTFFKAHSLADGEICENCENVLRGQFLSKTRRTRSGMVYQDDPIKRLTVDEAREILSEKQEEAAEAISDIGGDFANIFKADSAFSISPKPLDVGLKRAKLLNDKGVLRGLVVAGSFNQGDAVYLKQWSGLRPTTILELIPITTTSEFKTELGANMHKKTVSANSNAWFILDVPGAEVGADDMIVK